MCRPFVSPWLTPFPVGGINSSRKDIIILSLHEFVPRSGRVRIHADYSSPSLASVNGLFFNLGLPVWLRRLSPSLHLLTSIRSTPGIRDLAVIIFGHGKNSACWFFLSPESANQRVKCWLMWYPDNQWLQKTMYPVVLNIVLINKYKAVI